MICLLIHDLNRTYFGVETVVTTIIAFSSQDIDTGSNVN